MKIRLTDAKKIYWTIVEDNAGGLSLHVNLDEKFFYARGGFEWQPFWLLEEIAGLENARVRTVLYDNLVEITGFESSEMLSDDRYRIIGAGAHEFSTGLGDTALAPGSMGVSACLAFGVDDGRLLKFTITDEDWGESVTESYFTLARAWLRAGWTIFRLDRESRKIVNRKTGDAIAIAA